MRVWSLKLGVGNYGFVEFIVFLGFIGLGSQRLNLAQNAQEILTLFFSAEAFLVPPCPGQEIADWAFLPRSPLPAPRSPLPAPRSELRVHSSLFIHHSSIPNSPLIFLMPSAASLAWASAPQASTNFRVSAAPPQITLTLSLRSLFLIA